MKSKPFYVIFCVLLASYLIDWISGGLVPGGYYWFSSVFLVTFGVFFIVNRYSVVKEILYGRHLRNLKYFVYGQHFSKSELMRFLLISIVTTLVADIYIVKFGNQAIGIVTGLLPEPFSSSIQESLETVLANYTSFGRASSSPGSADSTDSNPNYLMFIKFAPGPPIGATVVFLLRQLHYQKLVTYPGIRILFAFMVASPIVVVIDFMALATENKLWNPDFNATEDSTYGLEDILRFASNELIVPWFYAAIAVTWIFDWYLFSRLWKYNERLKLMAEKKKAASDNKQVNE